MIEKYVKLAAIGLAIIIWSLVGLTLWVPLLVRVVFVYTAMVTSSMFADVSLDRSTNALEAASTFYIDGFKKILKSHLSRSSSNPGTTKTSKSDYSYQSRNVETDRYHLNFQEIAVVIANVFWSILFWYLFKNILSGQQQDLLDRIIFFVKDVFEKLVPNTK